ncbi:MAG: pyrroloquinoline quinone-dependent dehydrogenase [Pseudomonadales bacterium]|nr:pyrroloquinoline quinone-dependent dehydrogenase [Pseudomonadales bacterium]
MRRTRILVALVWLLVVPWHPGHADPSRYGMDGGQKYSPLTDITPENVHSLEPAWRYHSGDLGEGFRNREYSFQATPVYRDGVLYVSTSGGLAIALDATTGKERWRFDAQIPRDIWYSEHASRGVTLWHDPDGRVGVACADTVFLPTRVGVLVALDASTGEPCPAFGVDGRVDLRASALPPESDVQLEPGEYGVTSPPVVFESMVIVGSAVGDNRAVALERGVVRALDARTGREVWRFDPVPRRADDPAYASWSVEGARRTGAANAWAPLSVDAALGLVFVPTSSPSPDFYGGMRPGDNRYANSIVALEARTGRVAWHQQLVHHDVWDYDVPAQPVLTEIVRDGARVPAVLVGTKTGMLFTFRRDNGEPLHGMEERPVPASDVPGEVLSPTQPFSRLPAVADQRRLTPDDAFGILLFDKWACRRILREYRSEGLFTPPSIKGSILNPGWAGGVNWGGVAVDAGRQVAVVNVIQGPGLVRLIPRDELDDLMDSGELEDWEVARQAGTPYAMARRLFLSPLGLPCTPPPWGKLVAVDLTAAKILWDVPLGTVRDLAPAVVPNFAWGVPGIGGPLVTASGLIFIGAAGEFVFRAYAVDDGRELWRAELPTSANATPTTYQVDGVQYVVVAVGGHGGLGLPRGDVVMAWRLPATR